MLQNSSPSFFHTQDGVRIFYSTNFGQDNIDTHKDVIIFNYGLMCNWAHFKPQIIFLEELGYKILLHDYRGHYSSSCPDGLETCTFDKMTTDLNELINHLKIESCIMIGHSMGVNITLEYATRFPLLVKKMILISGSVFPPQDVMFDGNAVEILTPLTKWITTSFPKQFNYIWKTSFKNPIARFIIKDGGFNKQQVDDEFVQLYMKKISELPKEIFLHLLDEMKFHGAINHLEKINIPTLIIGGDKDKVIPNYLQKILHEKISLSELYIVKNGSHVPQIDFPDFVNSRLRTFLLKPFLNE